RQLLRDHSAERVSEDVAYRHAKTIQKGQSVSRHAGDCRRYRARGASDAGVVEKNDFPAGCERIGDRRVPVVERAGEVLKTEKRTCGARAKAAVGIPLFTNLQELGWSSDVAGYHCNGTDSSLRQKDWRASRTRSENCYCNLRSKRAWGRCYPL